MLNFLKFESINLVTLTSYSSQLSFIITQQFFINEKKERYKYPKDIYLVFIFPSTSDPHANNSVEIKKFFKSNKNNRDSKIFVIKTLKIWQRILLSPLFYMFKILINKPIYLWQARYNSTLTSFMSTNQKAFTFKATMVFKNFLQ